MVVEENVFQRKKREGQEEAEEMEEKKRWEVFKANHKPQPKRRREYETVPEGWKAGQNKRLKRMSLEAEVWDLADWWTLAEGMCLRAGKLRRRICLDKARVLRMMETYTMDRILSETPAWWNMAMAWTGSDSSLVEEPSYQEKHPTSLQDIEEGRQQEGTEDGCVEPTEPAPTTPEEVETCVGGRYPTKNTPNHGPLTTCQEG